MLKGELQMAAVKLVDGYSDLECFHPFGFIFMIVNDAAVLILRFDSATQRYDARNGLAPLVAHSHRHLHIFLDRFDASPKFTANQRQVQVVAYVTRKNDFRKS